MKIANKPATLEIEAVGSSGAATGPDIVARVTSDQPYPGLGIEKGENYLVRVKSGSQQSVYLISMQPYNRTPLQSLDHELSSGDPHEPRIVSNEFSSSPGPTAKTPDMIAYAFCIDDPSCSTQHCGYNYY